MSDKIFVLASNSFSGAWFVDYCLAKGAEVVGISRSPEARAVFLPYATNARRESFRFYQMDLNEDMPAIVALIRDFQPDYLVDYAGQGMVAQSWDQPQQWFKTNVLSKVVLHEELRKLTCLKKYVRFSTPEVYGNTEGDVSETAPLNPSTPYAVSHAAIDMNLLAYHRQYGFPVALTRATNVYGPHQQLYRIIPRSILYAKTGRKLRLDGGGHSIRNFVFIEDVCEAVWTVMRDAPAGEVYHVASDEWLSIRELVRRICIFTGVDFNDFVKVTADRPGKDKAYYLQKDKIERELAWKSSVTLDEGLMRTLDWVTEELNEICELPLDYIHKP
jgi:dTDP-glucose 4,6-dehydratase